MKKQESKRFSDKFIKFSIGAKLVTIITILVLVSLGAITFLVSYFVRQDLRISAEESNFELNRRTTAETEYTFDVIKSNSQVLIQIINAAGEGSALARQAADFFFEQNNNIAALVFPAAGPAKHFLVNDSFFFSRIMDVSAVNAYYEENSAVYERAQSGESVFLNATPWFSTRLLALFFPINGGEAFSVLFSPENLNDSFNSLVNLSFLINNDGDILIHPEFELVKNAANIKDREYIRRIRETTMRNRQDLREDEGVKFFVAYTKLINDTSIAITTVEYDKLFEGINATIRRNLYLTAAVLSLSILFIWFFAKSISVALRKLSAAARNIEGGNFDVDLTPKSRDEIGYLTASFQKMSKALAIFGRFTNRDLAIKAMRGQIKPGGLSKHATIFFSDIRGFTEKSENFTKVFGRDASDKIVFWLNNYLTQMVECVAKTNGVVDKFIGDAVMAHWGTAYSAGSPAKDAFNCVKTALMMRKAIVLMNKNRRPGDPADPPINIGCGINTGVVTAGQIGSDIRMEYTAIGNPVNLASRIEALNKPLGTDILISEYTWNLVKYYFITEEMPPVTVKGIEKPLRIFAVINHVSVTTGPKTLDEVRTLLDIEPPDMSEIDLNAEEVKYKIGAEK